MRKLGFKDMYLYGLAEEHNEGCDGRDTEALIDVFWRVIRKLDVSPVSKADCDLREDPFAIECCIEYFNLTVEKITTPEDRQWIGTFTWKDQYLKLFSIPAKQGRTL